MPGAVAESSENFVEIIRNIFLGIYPNGRRSAHLRMAAERGLSAELEFLVRLYERCSPAEKLRMRRAIGHLAPEEGFGLTLLALCERCRMVEMEYVFIDWLLTDRFAGRKEAGQDVQARFFDVLRKLEMRSLAPLIEDSYRRAPDAGKLSALSALDPQRARRVVRFQLG